MNQLPTRLQHLAPILKAKVRMQFIYVIRCEDFIKVGIADNPKARLIQMQTGNPFKLELLNVMRTSDPLRDERAIHDALGKRWGTR